MWGFGVSTRFLCRKECYGLLGGSFEGGLDYLGEGRSLLTLETIEPLARRFRLTDYGKLSLLTLNYTRFHRCGFTMKQGRPAMKTSLTNTVLLWAVIIGVLCPGVGAQESEDPTAMTLERAIHFLAPDGSDELVQPGNYRVEAADHGLQLSPEEGKVRLIAAEISTHEEELDGPLVVSLAGQVEKFKDIHMVMLLLPGGQSLEAAGSYSSVRERALQLKRVASFKKRTQSKIRRAARRFRASRAGGPAGGRLTAFRLSGLWIHDESVSQGYCQFKPGLAEGTWGANSVIGYKSTPYIQPNCVVWVEFSYKLPIPYYES